jgi:cytosine/adenosine deaminase-related metal-dependent hydrolase
MRRFSAQYVYTGNGPLLKRATVTADDNGTIISVKEAIPGEPERHSTEFYNGVIVPGFVNCHCHLELSYLRDLIEPGGGLHSFIFSVRSMREHPYDEIIAAAQKADREMYDEGIALCADICNNSTTFEIKKESRIRYISLPEVFGIDPLKAGKRIEELDTLLEEASKAGIEHYPVPHSVYSVSLELFRLLKLRSLNNMVTSIHFLETPDEEIFLKGGPCALRESYKMSGLLPEQLSLASGHTEAVSEEITPAGNLLLIHNTFAGKKHVAAVKKRGNIFWCLCPASNKYIEGTMPPVEMLKNEECTITTGTDSLASNKRLSITEELKLLQEYFPSVPLTELLSWATVNGAAALGASDQFGKLAPGMRPGIVLLENVDLVNLRLMPSTSAKRLL